MLKFLFKLTDRHLTGRSTELFETNEKKRVSVSRFALIDILIPRYKTINVSQLTIKNLLIQAKNGESMRKN